MEYNKIHIWKKCAIAGLAAGLGLLAYICLSNSDAGQVEVFNYSLLTVLLAWAGAFTGGIMDWARYRRSPFEPVFKVYFRWYYQQKYWLRFAVVFSFAWIFFVFFAAGLALAVGEKDEAAAFFTLEGIALVIIFCFIFAFEGAIIGGIVDIVRHIYRQPRPPAFDKN